VLEIGKRGARANQYSGWRCEARSLPWMLMEAAGWNKCSELGRRYAHRCNLPASESGGAAPDCRFPVHTQTQAKGILAFPVGTQTQFRRTVLRIKCSLLVMVPPRAVQAGALRPGAKRRKRAEAQSSRTTGSGGVGR